MESKADIFNNFLTALIILHKAEDNSGLSEHKIHLIEMIEKKFKEIYLVNRVDIN